MKKLKVGLIGCGTIGRGFAEKLVRKLPQKAALAYLNDLHDEKARELKQKLLLRAEIVTIPELIRQSDIVIEAASPQVSGDIAVAALKAHKRVLIMSSGGLLSYYDELMRLVKKTRGELLLPSGAIAGIDAITSVWDGEIYKVNLTTTKPVRGLLGAPYFERHNINLLELKKDTTIFEGNVFEAVKNFPENINVAACLSFAALGPKKIRVKIIASPTATRNTHQVEVEGDFGRILTRTENVPSPGNPKTSYLAVLSAFATLEKSLSHLKIGT